MKRAPSRARSARSDGDLSCGIVALSRFSNDESGATYRGSGDRGEGSNPSPRRGFTQYIYRKAAGSEFKSDPAAALHRLTTMSLCPRRLLLVPGLWLLPQIGWQPCVELRRQLGILHASFGGIGKQLGKLRNELRFLLVLGGF